MEPKQPEEKTVRVRLLRARWDDNGQRMDAGTELDLPYPAAIEAIEKGLVETVKAIKDD